MPFKVGFEKQIPASSNVVIAVSMENTFKEGGMLQSGEKLAAQIQELKDNECKVTILVADELQIHNFCLPSDKPDVVSAARAKARSMGNDFLFANIDQASQFTSPEDLDNEIKAVTIQGCPVIRWSQYLAEKKELFKDMLELVEKETKGKSHGIVETEFYQKMVKTFEESKTGASGKLENSLNLQKEEYAAILAMREFDFLVYPKLSRGMAYVCGPHHFLKDKDLQPIKKPVFSKVNLRPIQVEVVSIQKPKGPLPYDIKGVIDTFSMLTGLLDDMLKKKSEHSENIQIHLSNLVELYPGVFPSAHKLNQSHNPTKNTLGASFFGSDKEGTLSVMASPTPIGGAISVMATPPDSRPDLSPHGTTLSVIGGPKPRVSAFSFIGNRSDSPTKVAMKTATNLSNSVVEPPLAVVAAKV